MDAAPEMSWTCPDCQTRNAAAVGPDAEAGKIVDVDCRTCGTQHQASVFFGLTQAGAPLTVGIVWI